MTLLNAGNEIRMNIEVHAPYTASEWAAIKTWLRAFPAGPQTGLRASWRVYGVLKRRSWAPCGPEPDPAMARRYDLTDKKP